MDKKFWVAFNGDDARPVLNTDDRRSLAGSEAKRRSVGMDRGHHLGCALHGPSGKIEVWVEGRLSGYLTSSGNWIKL